MLLIASFASGQTKPVFACNMGKLSADQRKELSAAMHSLIGAKPATKELPNGYQMTFASGDHLVDALTWIRYERLCCPFFDFSVTLANNNGPMVINLSGPKGVKEFIEADLPVLKQMTHEG